MKIKSLVLGAIMLLGTITTWGQTYYVSTSGSNSNSGSLSSPWLTIDYAVNEVSAGATIYVRGGTYSERVEFENSGSASAGHITLENYSGENPIIDGSSLNGNGIVQLFGVSYIKVIGFEIQNIDGGDTPQAIQIEGACTNIEIRDNVIHDVDDENGNAHGMSVYGTSSTAISDLIIDGNEIYNCNLGNSEAMVLNGNVDGFVVSNNIIHDNDNIGIDFIGFEGTGPTDATDQARNGSCIGNYVYNISSEDNGTYDDRCADGIYVDGGRDIIIEQNIIDNCDIGIEIASEWSGKTTSDITIRNNFISRGYQGNILVGGYDSDRGSAEDIIIVNNTLYQGDDSEIALQYNCDGVTIKNNIMYASSTDGYIQNWGSSNSNITVSDNLYYGGSTSESGDWSDSNPTFSDPKLVSGYSDMHISSSSPAIDNGTSLSSTIMGTEDIDGNSRTYNTVDQGAHEYGSSDDGGSTDVSVTGVSVSPTSRTLTAGNTQQLSTTVSPTDATDDGVSYNSNSTSVATVSSSGLITAVAEGSATITVTTDDGGYTATCTVTVSASTNTAFVPDPDKTYYIDCPELDFRLAATGESEDAYTTTTSTTGEDVEWKFTDKGNGYWHLDRAAGGTSPRLRTDNTANADMQTTTYSGTYTYYDFATGASSSTYFLTLPDGPTSYCRLQIDNTGAVNMVSTASAGTWESFSITEVTEEVVELTNLALEQSVTASDYEQTATPPSNTVDGDSDSRWAASGYSQWLQVDLGATYSISSTELVCYNDRAYQYITEVSTDGSSYTQIVDRSSNSTGGSNDAPITDEFTEVDARYVRITVSGADSYTGTWVSLEEFRVYGDASSAKSTEGASSIAQNDLNLDMVIYPNPATEFITYDLQDVTSVSKLNIYSSTGQLIQTEDIDAAKGNINVSKLSKGLYFINVDGSTAVKSFIKE